MLYYHLNRSGIQARVDHSSGLPYLVKVDTDPVGEVVLSEEPHYDPELVSYLLPLSNGMRTFRVISQDGECAMWIESEEIWKEAPRIK